MTYLCVASAVVTLACAGFGAFAFRDVAMRLFEHREKLARLKMDKAHEQQLSLLSEQVESLESELRRVHLSRVR